MGENRPKEQEDTNGEAAYTITYEDIKRIAEIEDRIPMEEVLERQRDFFERQMKREQLLE